MLVIASGSHARRLGSLEDELVLRTLADALAIREQIADSADVVIVGAGPLGMEIASGALDAGCRVTIVTNATPMSRVLGEYLDGLPYRSKSLSMTQDLWLSLSVAEQEDFIDELDSKIRLYETFHNDMANWVRFGNAEPGDALYRVPLSTLP